MPWYGWVILIVVNAPIFFLLGKMFFKDWGDFGEAIVFWLKPDLWSALEGQFWEDWWAEIKLGLFVLICGLVIFAEYSQIVVPYVLPMFQANV